MIPLIALTAFYWFHRRRSLYALEKVTAGLTLHISSEAAASLLESYKQPDLRQPETLQSWKEWNELQQSWRVDVAAHDDVAQGVRPPDTDAVPPAGGTGRPVMNPAAATGTAPRKEGDPLLKWAMSPPPTAHSSTGGSTDKKQDSFGYNNESQGNKRQSPANEGGGDR